jgi:hypothetical protein
MEMRSGSGSGVPCGARAPRANAESAKKAAVSGTEDNRGIPREVAARSANLPPFRQRHKNRKRWATRGTTEVVQRPRLFSLNSQYELVAPLRSLHA